MFTALVSFRRFSVIQTIKVNTIYLKERSEADLVDSINTLTFKESCMVPFYGWGSPASRLQRHHEETVYFLLLSSQEFLVLI